MNYVVTLPKTNNWDDYLLEVSHAHSNRLSLFFKIPYKVEVRYLESKCYIVHDGAVRGWMDILTCTENPVGFTCFTTGKKWSPGIYLERKPPLYLLKEPWPMKGFRGIRCVEHIK